MKKLHGNAITVDTSIMELMLLKYVHYVITHKHTSENKILATSSFFTFFFFCYQTLTKPLNTIKKPFSFTELIT